MFMVKGKTPRLDGVVVILFLHHWHVIGNDGFEMINEPIGEGSLPACMTKRLITLVVPIFCLRIVTLEILNNCEFVESLKR